MTLLFKEATEKITSPKILDCVVIDVFKACKLNLRWHSRLPIIDWSNVTRNKYYICYGASYKNIMYAIAIWSSPVAANRLKNGDSMLELRRLAISPEAPKFTATWMLGKMVKDIKKRFLKITKLLSYQDTEYHTGIIYKAGNWQKHTIETKFIDWTATRKRRAMQSKSNKIRWEYFLRGNIEKNP